MPGPQLAAAVATVVALTALAGVGMLVLQVRRLRAEVAAAEPAPRAGGPSDSRPQLAPAESTREPGPEPQLAPEPEPAPPPAPVVELLPVAAVDIAPVRVATGSATGSTAGSAADRPAGVPDPTSPATAGVPSRQQVVAATLVHPLVRVSAVAFGVRRALRPENRDRVRALVRRDLRRRHKVRRQAARRAARLVPIQTVTSDRREESAS